jgi:hypothetical protein
MLLTGDLNREKHQQRSLLVTCIGTDVFTATGFPVVENGFLTVW